MKREATDGLTFWPVNLEKDDVDVVCIGFSELALPYIRAAVLDGRATCVGRRPSIDNGSGAKFEFDFLGFRYELVGFCKEGLIHVESIEKIAKVDLADVNVFHEEFLGDEDLIVEDYRAKRLREQPDYATW